MKAVLILFSLITILFAQKNEDVASNSIPLFKNDRLWFELYKVQMEHTYYYTVNQRYYQFVDDKIYRRKPSAMFIRSGQPVKDVLNQLVKEKVLTKGKITLKKSYTEEQNESLYKLVSSLKKKYGSVGAEMMGFGHIRESQIDNSDKMLTLDYQLPHKYYLLIRQIEEGKDLDKIIYPNKEVNASSTPQELWTAYLHAYSELESSGFDNLKKTRKVHLARLKLMIETEQIITKNYAFSYRNLSPIQKLKYDKIEAPLTRQFGWSLATEMLGKGRTYYNNLKHTPSLMKTTRVYLPKNVFEESDKILTSFINSKPTSSK